jgi:uncharacterized protein with HEPN domain
MLESDRVRLQHILDAANEALEFTKGKNRTDLEKDRILAHALVRLLEIIGEAAAALSKDFRKRHPERPWKQAVGMRNRLIHGYFDIDLDVVWQTVFTDIGPLRDQVERILRE